MEHSDGHRERLRQRYLEEGADHFQDYEVLELHLHTLLPRVDTRSVAKRLLSVFGSLHRVYEASPEDLARVEGVGAKTAFALSLLPALARRYSRNRHGERPDLSGRGAMSAFCADLFIGEKYEASRMILLDNRLRLLRAEVVARGTIDQAPVYARNIAEAALRHQAKYVVLAHNHPGGTARPSQEDLLVTARIARALEPLEIHLLDHFIVADGVAVSVKEEG